jgi:hypothetical protein
MDPVYVPLLSALAGVIIGSLSSIATILIQAKIGDRRERFRQAASLAMEDFKVQIANAPSGTGVPPFSTFLHHYLAVFKAIDDDDLTPERLRTIAVADDKIVAAVNEIDREWRAKQKGPPATPPLRP